MLKNVTLAGAIAGLLLFTNGGMTAASAQPLAKPAIEKSQGIVQVRRDGGNRGSWAGGTPGAWSGSSRGAWSGGNNGALRAHGGSERHFNPGGNYGAYRAQGAWNGDNHGAYRAQGAWNGGNHGAYRAQGAWNGGNYATFRRHYGGRHFYPRHHRRFYGYGYYAAPVYSYYSGDECYWLKRRAVRTGSPYWWRRYEECRWG